MAAKKAPAKKMAAPKKPDPKKPASAADFRKKEEADKKKMDATKKKMDADKQAKPGSYTVGRAVNAALKSTSDPMKKKTGSAAGSAAGKAAAAKAGKGWDSSKMLWNKTLDRGNGVVESYYDESTKAKMKAAYKADFAKKQEFKKKK